MPLEKTLTTVRLDKDDRDRIAKLRKVYLLPSDAAAIRAALKYASGQFPPWESPGTDYRETEKKSKRGT